MKALVFGAGGWLGARLVERLVALGREVVCVDIRVGSEISALRGVEIVEADIRDSKRYAERLRECSVVFNCAGLLHPKKTKDIYAVNRDAVVALYRACVEAGVLSFVHISSINAQGENPTSTDLLAESTPLRPITHYGISKAECDVALQKMHIAGQTHLIILRPGVFYGERPSRNLREFMDKLRTSRMPLFSQRGMLRTYVDVDKVVEALLLAESNGRSGEAYLIGDQEPLSTLRFYQTVAEALGTRPKTLRLPLLVARICERLALFAGRLNVHLRLFTIVGEFGRHTFCTVEKAGRELGFSPNKSSEDGLKRMVRSVR